MSYQLFVGDVLFYQRFLKAGAFYTDVLDGIWGEKTNKADEAFTTISAAIANEYGIFDSRSERSIMSLLPKAQIEARKFLKLSAENNTVVKIISGTRTYQEQDELYSHGRNGNTLPIVTKAKGGQSNHNFGIAWDIGLYDGVGNYIANENPYISIAPTVLEVIDNLEWGGNWHSFKDYPHYQLKAVTEDVASIRNLFESGNNYV